MSTRIILIQLYNINSTLKPVKISYSLNRNLIRSFDGF